MLLTPQRLRLGFTLIELLLIIAIGIVIAGVLLAALARARSRSTAICCNCNLKQIGLSFRIWANDHGDQNPMHVSTNQGGTLEFVPGGNGFRHVQALSNELSTPKILICPSDSRKVAADFSTLSNTNLSYFVSLDASEAWPQMLLSGDRFIGVKGFGSANVLPVGTNAAVYWTKKIHDSDVGNIAHADGSVVQLIDASLQSEVRTQGVTTNRLAIP